MTVSPVLDVTAEKRWGAWRRIPIAFRMWLFLLGILVLGCLWTLGRDALREFSYRRISVGMTQAEVEGWLGEPNPLPAMKRENRAFWDTYCWFGSRYISRAVHYDVNGNVDETTTSDFWRVPTWWESMRRAF